MDQRHLAHILGLSPQRLSDMERGYTPVPDEFQTQLQDALRSILGQRLAAVDGLVGEAT